MAKWIKKNLVTMILVIVILAGLCLLLYPTVSDRWNAYHQSKAIASYVEAVEGISEEEMEEMLKAAEEYNGRLRGKENHWVMSEAEYAEYESLLDLTGTGIMGYVEIPSVNIRLPIYHGTDEAVLQIASGHIAGTSLPVGGENTHAAVSGHRGLPSARLFTDIDQLSEGDVFMITVLNRTVTYKVDQISVVVPEDTSEMEIINGGDYCTLQTCTPYGVNTHRLLVRGRRIGNIEIEEEAVVASEASRVPTYIVIPAVGVPILFVLLAALLFYYRRKGPGLNEEELIKKLKEKLKDDNNSPS